MATIAAAQQTLGTIAVYFNPGDVKRWLRALSRVEAEVSRSVYRLPREGAMEYSNLLIANIMWQRHMGGYAALNPRYADWKAKYGRGGRQHWVLFTDLVRNIKAWNLGSTTTKSEWQGGIPAGVSDQGGKSWLGKGNKGRPMSIAQYGRWGEYGRRGQPARPIFGPTADEYSNKYWITKCNRALMMVGREWRPI